MQSHSTSVAGTAPVPLGFPLRTPAARSGVTDAALVCSCLASLGLDRSVSNGPSFTRPRPHPLSQGALRPRHCVSVVFLEVAGSSRTNFLRCVPRVSAGAAVSGHSAGKQWPSQDAGVTLLERVSVTPQPHRSLRAAGLLGLSSPLRGPHVSVSCAW